HSDIDDLIPMLTAFQIEWNKLHRRLQTVELPAEWGDVTALEAGLAEPLGVAADDLDRLRRVWGAELPARLRALPPRPVKLSVRLLASSLNDYRRAHLDWYEHLETASAPLVALRERPIYFVSSNTHSLINLLSGFALRHREALLRYLAEAEHTDLQAEWRDIQSQQVPSSAENFLYYLLKKYAHSPEGREMAAARAADEAACGL